MAHGITSLGRGFTRMLKPAGFGGEKLGVQACPSPTSNQDAHAVCRQMMP